MQNSHIHIYANDVYKKHNKNNWVIDKIEGDTILIYFVHAEYIKYKGYIL